MKKSIIYISFLLVGTALSAQDRNVFWVHGLNDDANFWNRQYANAQRDYRIRSYGSTYYTKDGVQNYANRVRTGSNSIRGNQTIAVGHSLGGVAIREANRDDNGLYGGMITLGAPLDGARLANEVIGGGANRFIAQSIENLRRGPIATKSRTAWQTFVDTVGDVIRGEGKHAIIRIFASALILDITEDLAGGFQETILNLFNPNDPSVRDLAEYSSYLNSIRNFQSNQPKILAWGNEDSPVHARLLASSMTQDENYANLLITAYNEVGNFYKTTADGINYWRWPCFASCKRKRREKEAWNAGADYIRRGWEIAWNNLTGARFHGSYTTTEQVYVCESSNPLQLTPYGVEEDDDCYSTNYCNSCRWETQTVTRSRSINMPSDGLIRKSSQVGERSQWGGEEVELISVNHLEMGVHNRVDKLFRDAFNGQHGLYFRTPKR